MHEIAVHGVSKRFDGVDALRSVDLIVRAGEFLSILGPSGCGKSTLLRIIAGLEAPNGGEVVIAGRTVTHSPVWKRQIGFVFQNFALWPHLTVFRNVAMGLELRRRSKSEIRDSVMAALRLVQLEGFAERLPSQLSGGQQQRVALARAVAIQPAVLLLDEPLGALDKNLRQDMQVELKALQRTLGVTAIFVTHDQEEALSLSDRVAVMNRGVVEQVDTPEAIYSRPASPYVARFVGETALFEGRVVATAIGSVLQTSDGLNVPLEGSSEARGHATAFVRPEWITIDEAGASSSLSGRIEQVLFFGASRDYLVRVGERTLRVRATGLQRCHAEGEVVRLRFEARLLRAQ